MDPSGCFQTSRKKTKPNGKNMVKGIRNELKILFQLYFFNLSFMEFFYLFKCFLAILLYIGSVCEKDQTK